MADSFETFVKRVFRVPDLTLISEFNAEIQSYLSSQMGLTATGPSNAPLNTKFSSSTSAPANSKEDENALEAVSYPYLLPPKMRSPSHPSLNELKYVDELSDVENFQRFLRHRNVNRSHGEESSGMDSSPHSASSVKGLSIFDSPSTHHQLMETRKLIVKTPDEEGRCESGTVQLKSTTLASPSFSLEKKSLEPGSRSVGLLLHKISYHWCTGAYDRIGSVAFTSAIDHRFISTAATPYAIVRDFSYEGGVEPLVTLEEDNSPITFMTVSPDFGLLAICKENGVLYLYHLTTYQLILALEHPSQVTCCNFSPNGQYIVSGCLDGKCRVWMTSYKCMPTEIVTYSGLHDRVSMVRFQTYGGLIAAGTYSGEIHLWSGRTADLIHSIAEMLFTSPIIALEFNWDGEVLLSADKKYVLLSEVKTGSSLRLLVTGDGISSPIRRGVFENSTEQCFTFAAFAPQHCFPNYFFVGKGDCTVVLYEFSTTKKKEARETSLHRSLTTTINLDIKEEVWSDKLKAPITCASAGHSNHILFGDTAGNVLFLTMEPASQYITNYPYSPTAKHSWISMESRKVYCH